MSIFFFDRDPGPPRDRFGVDCCAGSEASRLFESDIVDGAGDAAAPSSFGDAESDGGLFEALFNRSLIFSDGVPAI